MRVQIREGTAADWSACWNMDVSYSTESVWQLRSQQNGESYESAIEPVRLPRPLTLRDPLWRANGVTSVGDDGVLLVADSSLGVIGFTLVAAESLRDVNQLVMLAVVGHARRQGIGRRLLAAAIDAARGRGGRALCATLQARNYPAIAFVRAAGFAFAGYDEQFFPSNDVALFFAHRLRKT